MRRLPVYLRALLDAHNEGLVTISSDELGNRVGANAAQVRKDLSYLGSYGTRGIGYDIELLQQQINRQLGLDKQFNVALVGAGNLGQALGNYGGFAERGFHVVAAFDTDQRKVGHKVGAAEVFPLSELGRVVREKNITMALIATPASVAQDIADRLVEAGVSSVLNFAPTIVNMSPEVCVRKVDLAVELQILGYYDHLREVDRGGAVAAGGAGSAAPSEAPPMAPAPTPRSC